MPRKLLIRTPDYPYHVTSRANNKESFYINIKHVWSYCVFLLNKASKEFGVNVHSFVLMDNHYHLLIDTPNSNIDQFMKFFNQNLSLKISRKAKRMNRIFATPYKWSLIKDDSYYQNVFRYIYQNPLRAEMVKRCEDYEFSTLRQKIKLKSKSVQLKSDHKVLKYNINWINELFDEVERTIISRGLKSGLYEEKLSRVQKLRLKIDARKYAKPLER